MQHLRSMGESSDAVLLEAPSKSKDKGKGKAKEIVFGEKVLNTAIAGFANLSSLESQGRFLRLRKRRDTGLNQCRISLIVYGAFNPTWIQT